MRLDACLNTRVFRVDPVAYVRQTQADRWKKRSSVLKYRAFRDVVRLQAGNWLPPDDAIIQFHIPMPKSWSKKRRAAMEGKRHRQTPDLDNLCKAFYDCFGEDKHISGYTARKFWAAEGSIIVIENKEDGM